MIHFFQNGRFRRSMSSDQLQITCQTQWTNGQCTGIWAERSGFEYRPDQCVVFLGKTLLLSQCLSAPWSIEMGTGELSHCLSPPQSIKWVLENCHIVSLSTLEYKMGTRELSHCLSTPKSIEWVLENCHIVSLHPRV